MRVISGRKGEGIAEKMDLTTSGNGSTLCALGEEEEQGKGRLDRRGPPIDRKRRPVDWAGAERAEQARPHEGKRKGREERKTAEGEWALAQF